MTRIILTLLAPPTLTYLLAWLWTGPLGNELLPFYAPEWVPYELARIALKWTLTAVFGTIAVCGLVGEVRERLA